MALVLLADTGSGAGLRGAGHAAVLFESDRAGAEGLYLVNSDGTGFRELIANGGRGRWSPDGTKLLFARTTGFLVDTYYVVGLDGHAPRRLPAGGYSFAWSPDGRRLVYLSGGNIHTVKPDGSGDIKVTSDGKLGVSVYLSPTLSPDGETIAALKDDSLVVVGASGGVARVVAGNVDSGPVWSPDGSEIAFGTFHDATTGGAIIAAVHPDGIGLRTVAKTTDDPEGLTWSPDGRKIAFETFEGVFVVAAAGGEPLRIHGTYGGFSWSPDSSALTFADDHDIWLASLAGSSQKRLTSALRYGYTNDDPQWQPRGIPAERLGGTKVSPAIPTDSVIDGKTLETRNRIDLLAADGARVSIGYAAGDNSVEVWDERARTLLRLYENEPSELALAGTRVGWVDYESHNHEYYSISSATIACPAPVTVSSVTDEFEGDLAGDGTLLVFARAKFTDSGGTTQGTVWRVKGNRAVQIGSDPASLDVLSVDRGRIAVVKGNGPVEIVAANGALVRTIPFRKGEVKGAALTGETLVIERHKSLAVYNVGGRLEHTWPLRGSGYLADADGNIAVYVTGTKIHLLRLSDGREATLEAPGKTPVLAQLEAPGLFYSYTVPGSSRPGRVAFVPTKTLLQRFH